MERARILGTGSYLPGEPITNEQMDRLVGSLTDDLLQGISIQRRFWMIDPQTGAHRESNSEMATKAAQQALDTAGVAPEEVDLLILSTGTPDYPLPATVNLVMDRLKIKRCATLEIRSGGAGAVQGLDLARMYLERGVYRTAVVVGSEAISPAMVPIYRGKDPQSIRMRDRLPLYMFGDGAGAMVLRAVEGEGGIVSAGQACVGGGRKPGIHSLGGGSATPVHEQVEMRNFPGLKVDVVGSGEFTPYMVTDALATLFGPKGVPLDSVDLCLIPEGNVGWMLDALKAAGLETREWVGLEGKVFDNLALTGAVGSAAVPLFLDEAWRSGRVKPGSRVMLIGVESTKWIWAGAVVDWTAPSPAGGDARGR
jgi:3-oxoacyl-[acyl-carrier-protein] synthase-3